MTRTRVLLEPAADRIVSSYPAPAAREAFAGPIGAYVRELEPLTEADPHAVLGSALVLFGNAVGSGAHSMAGCDRHALNLFMTIVGATAQGRKGHATQAALQLLGGVDGTWRTPQTGLTSGEGLIYAVRDSRQLRQGRKVIEDPGVKDKRLPVIQTEFGEVLRVLKRDANVLSPVLRQAWDGGSLQTLAKNKPATATGAYISIIGHITVDELGRYLEENELFNGFANRFLWMCARRTKSLPEGGRLAPSRLLRHQKAVAGAVRFGKRTGELRRSPAAVELWSHAYDGLTDAHPGLHGIVTSRAAPQVVRLSCLYALLDRSAIVEEQHLRSALALWAYCDASARFIFGARSGNEDADKTLAALRAARPGGLTRTQLYRDVFGRNWDGDRIVGALRWVLDNGYARFETERGLKGRQTERWFAV